MSTGTTLSAGGGEAAGAAPRREAPSGASEADFYLAYEWCLNPVLSIRAMLAHLRRELDRLVAWPPGWQREEILVNVYLLACGVSCTLDDYLGPPRRPLSSLANRSRALRPLVAALQGAVTARALLRGYVVAPPVRAWARGWEACIDRCCELLASDAPPGAPDLAALADALGPAAARELPSRVLSLRMQVPCPFRSQDMSHQDVLALVDRLCAGGVEPGEAVLVLGPRTSGSYFAPLARARLAARGIARASWMTVRPRHGLGSHEERRLRRALRDNPRVVIVDDHPNTGRTHVLLLEALLRRGARAERIAILAPRHPARPDWTLPVDAPGAGRVRLVVLEPEELHKARYLDRCRSDPPFAAHYRRRGWQEVQVLGDGGEEAAGPPLEACFPGGWHVRLKRAFRVRLAAPDRGQAHERVFAKSVGWGWLGYHGYIAAARLGGRVPEVLALREGILFTGWVEHTEDDGPFRPEPRTMGSYVALRAERLRVREDPYLDDPSLARAGWEILLNGLQRAYRWPLGPLKRRALHRMLRAYGSPACCLVDGAMRPTEWVKGPAGPRKLDFEHHNFGRTELNIVDPVHDLTSAAFEFELSEEEQRDMVREYADRVPDPDVRRRLLPYQLVCGLYALGRAPAEIASAGGPSRREAWDRRFHGARTFLMDEVLRRGASLLPPHAAPRWGGPLLFLDVDGVLDRWDFGFPTTTRAGLQALALLKAAGVAVVLCTGRSGDQVASYCRAYGLPGGLAEHGALWVDAVAGRRHPLVAPQAQEQLERCRGLVRELPDVFVDRSYRCSVRVYRYHSAGTRRLPEPEVQAFLARHGLSRLSAVHTSDDTYFVARDTDKAAGVREVRRRLGLDGAPHGAIGDSTTDIAMLSAAEFAYAPANCARALREAAPRARIRILPQPRQKGLLAAARDFLARHPQARAPLSDPGIGPIDDPILRVLLAVPDRSTLRQAVALLHRAP